MGAAEIFAVLYGALLNQSAKGDPAAGPDRFVLSNGHICAGWYAALSLSGQIPREELRTHRRLGSRLQGHPSRHMFPQAVETSSGPLGQGMSVATGIALGKKLREEPGRVFCLAGDGELQEGIVWESALTAAHYKLDNLVLIVNDNDVQIDGHTSEVKNVRPIDNKFRSFGWNAIAVDGHEIETLRAALDADAGAPGQPRCVVAQTVMAKGVSFMEHDPKWHGACPSQEEAERALNELGPAEELEDF
jgi:transketolase